MKRYLAALITIGLMAGPALAKSPKAMNANDPHRMNDGTWITLSGTVHDVEADAFGLTYDDGVIRVEMDDGDRDADAYNLMVGDAVTVTGRIDENFFSTTTIEASTVFVEKLGTTFFASAVDEEEIAGDYGWSTYGTMPEATMVTGFVTNVGEDEFTLDTLARMLTVETEELGYDPLDDEGYQKIDVGDRVMVRGEMDYDLFEGRELVANSVVILSQATKPRSDHHSRNDMKHEKHEKSEHDSED